MTDTESKFRQRVLGLDEVAKPETIKEKLELLVQIKSTPELWRSLDVLQSGEFILGDGRDDNFALKILHGEMAAFVQEDGSFTLHGHAENDDYPTIDLEGLEQLRSLCTWLTKSLKKST